MEKQTTEDAKKELNNVMREINTGNLKVEKLNDEIEEKTERKKQLDVEAQEAIKIISEAKKETRPLSERVEKLKKEADSQEERAVEAVEKVKNATEEAKNKMREATHKAELATEGARKVVEKLENEAETVREDISTLLAEKTTLVGQNKALSTTKATNDEAINEQEQFIEKKTEEEAKIHDGIARADKTLQKHNKDIKTKRAELKVIETTISGVKKALVAGEKELKELVKGIATKKEEYAAQAKNLIIIADRETAVGQREVYAKKRFKEAGLTY